MSNLLPGTEVTARGLRWQVVFTQQLGQQTLFRLRGLEGALRGAEFDLLHPFEPITPLINDLQPTKGGSLRKWLVYHQAFLLEQALGADALLAVQPGRLRIEPYQLVPVLRAIRMSRPRLLLADAVGLGKTIQSGLILTELVARRIAHRILIVSPAGPLLDQWQDEMAERFGLRLQVIDRAHLEEVRRQTELGANPFDHIPLGLASIDFLKQERVLEQLERSSYDAVIIDEAHHCMDLGTLGEREDSQRRRLAQVLARRCDTLLLLTATPHDGNDRSFASLCELLDPSLVDGQGNLRGTRYQSHVIRRMKRHIVDPHTNQSLFRDRVVTPIAVTADPNRHPAFLALQRTLLDLIAPELRRAFKARRYDNVLAFIALLKRSVSTVAACQSTLTVVAERFQHLVTEGVEQAASQRERLRTLRDYHKRLERFGTLSAAEEADQQLLEAEELARQLADMQREVRRGSYQLKRTTDVMAALDELIELAEAAQAQDPKIARLITLVQEIRQTEPGANILIYTEYITSQQSVAKALRRAITGEVLTMSGEDNEATRREITGRFRIEEKLLLVSTDTAAEGLNLQDRCHHLIHVELPFNPNRLEQRNGRIDRYGQPRTPMVYYLYLRQTFEERILLRLIAKYERQRALLNFVPNTLGLTTSTDAAAERLLAGLMDEDEQLFQSNPPRFDFYTEEAEHGADAATRELLEEIDRSLKGYRQTAQTHSWLGDQGLSAAANLPQEADQARDRGDRISAVDLAHFVYDALLLDDGEIQGHPNAPSFSAHLPPNWSHGLTDLPGYNPQTRRIHLTTDITLTRDAQGNQVGFLGRAHPLVRRALDRVRTLSFGGAGQIYQDPRVSAVTAPSHFTTPVLLCTFLGRVMSRAGRALERVLAVQIAATGEPIFFSEAAAWLPLADRTRAISASGLWAAHFASWGDAALLQANTVAHQGFAALVATLQPAWLQRLDAETAALTEWFSQRVNEITGAAPSVVQIDLFAAITATTAPMAWSTHHDPLDRLAAFAANSSIAPTLRSEADGVLRIYRQRQAALAERTDLRPPEVQPLGLLMLLPP